MATTNKRLCAGTMGDTYSAIYTAPSGDPADYAIIKSLILCNKTNASKSVALKFDDNIVIYDHTIEANDTIVIPFTDAILESAEEIEGKASGAASVTFYISGIEVTA